MATASSVIVSALQMIGEKEIGATLSTAEETAYLSKLNMMLESWSIQRLMCYQIVQENFSLTTSTGTYTIGSGGTFNTTRPSRIVGAFIRTSDNSDYPLEIINSDSYNRITNKTVDGSYPNTLYYDAAFVSGLATIKLYPEPTSGLTLYIDSWKQLQSFATVGTTVSLPPGYQLAIESNLSILLSPGFRSVQPEVIKIARESKAAIESLNAPEGIARLDSGVSGQSRQAYNIYNG